MEQWRERGYVPDSDEDDEFESQQLIHPIGDSVEVEAQPLEDGSSAIGERDSGSQASRNAIEEDNIEVQHGSNASFDAGSPKGEIDDLENDPLQDDDGIGTRIPKEDKTFKRMVEHAGRPLNSFPHLEPPSSPDELQFEEFRPRLPQPPMAKPPEDSGGGLDIGSTSSSPLSSAPSSPGLLPVLSLPSAQNEEIQPEEIQPEEIQPEEIQPEEIVPTVRSASQETNGPILVDIDDIEDPADPNGRSGRALRQRNAIQLHPYLLENAQYRKLMKTRGVQPIRLTVEERQARNELDESQNYETQQDENVPPSSSPASFQFPPSSPINRASANSNYLLSEQTQAGNRRASAAMPNDSDHRRVSKLIESRNKRRKLIHTGDANEPNETTNGKKKKVQVFVDNNTEQARDSIFDVPLSPPLSGGPTSTLTREPMSSFRFPPGFSPVPMVTPVTERKIKPGAQEIVSIGSSPIQNLHESVPRLGSESQGSSEEENLDNSYEIQKIQRRIKGVLPASFARLDREKHEEQMRQFSEKAKRKELDRERRTGKGVAQRISRKEKRGNNETPSRNNMTFLSDGSESNDEAPYGSARKNDRSVEQRTLEELFGIYDDDDIPEDNRIDYMAPPIPRGPRMKRSHGPKHKGTVKRQSHGFRSPSHSKPRPKQQTRITNTTGHRQKVKSKPRLPKLGVLDTDDVINQQPEAQPQFLRVAARNARSRRDKGRQSPSRKVFRLATKNDTQDINSSLRGWKSGKFRPASTTILRQTQITQNPVRVRNDAQLPRNSRTSTGQGENTTPVEVDTEPMIIDDEDPTGHSRAMNWIVRRGYGLSSFRRNSVRPAQLAEDELPIDAPQYSSSFHRSLSALNATYRQTKNSRRLPLARFLGQQERTGQSRATSEGSIVQKTSKFPQPLDGRSKKKRIKKKQQPQHIDAEAIEYRQPQNFEHEKSDSISLPLIEIDESPSLIGLHPPQRPYSVDFDVRPLHIGTYFHQTTFIGSGRFAQSLRILSRDLDVDHGHATIHHKDKIYRWGPWNQTVSSEIGEIFDDIATAMRVPEDREDAALGTTSTSLRPQDLYKLVIGYITDQLSFIDPIDRINFITRCATLLSKFADFFESSFPDNSVDAVEPKITSTVVEIEMLNLVFSHQVYQITKNEVVDPSKAIAVANLVKLFANRIFDLILSTAGVRDIQQFLEDNKRLKKREAGIRSEYPFVDAYIVVKSIFQQNTAQEIMIGSPFSKQISALSLFDVRNLERQWRSIFLTLPLQEIDEFGIFHPGLRFQLNLDQWAVVKQLISNVFETYRKSGGSQWASPNNYLRALFRRCFDLIKNWGWRHCKPLLDCLFDFFTGNLLRNLENEESHGSPRFLDEIDEDPELEIEPQDTCFHIFLKIIAVGFRHMRGLFPAKRILNFVWRLLPNHGRMYPKEEPLQVEDLNALRNHHDLLCTLYCSVPIGCRPSLNTIRGLVHPPTSHREACSINIHSWSRLVRFALSKDGDTPDLSSFAEWHGDFTAEILRQHSQARSEVEAQDPSASIFPRRFIEDAIVKNERHAESLISDAVVCMKAAINTTKNMDQAAVLMERLPLGKLLGLFNPQVKRLDTVVCRVLDVLLALVTIDSRPLSSTTPEYQPEPIEPNEESQESGDWGGILEICDHQIEASSRGFTYLNQGVAPVLSRFMSSCFGHDITPDDVLLVKSIDCWISVARIRVNYGQRQWSSYFNHYDEDSWPVLGSTDQTRRFTPYFLSKLISSDPTSYDQCQSYVLIYWSASLVERDLFLKYQHELTSALLNEDRENPLLQNLPFLINRATGKYSITLAEFRQMRTSLISCILSNMRKHLSEIEPAQVQSGMNVAGLYRDMIRTLMSKMKQNSEEVSKANGLVPGSYVEFVHRIVEFLQEHSQDILPIDEYFTDPASFPLPASDPTYVTAKLKRYGLRLSAGKVAKQLVMFIQSVSERAAIDAQQVYLVNQFYEAMSNTFESGSYQQPTLRCFMLQCVIPAYVTSSLSNPAAWILTRPLLHSTTRIFTDLMLDIDTTREDEVNIIVDSIATYFEAIYRTLALPVNMPSVLHEAPVLLTITSLLETIISSFTVIDYLDRLGNKATNLLLYVNFFKQFALFAVASLLDPEEAVPPSQTSPPSQENIDDRVDGPRKFFADTRDFAASELELWLQDSWSLYDGKYFVRRGQQSVEIYISPNCLSVEVAKTAFLQTVGVFFGSMELLDTFSC